MSRRTEVSRRAALRCGLAAIAGGVAAGRALADPRDEVAQVSKERVHYQWSPNAEGSHCSICANFVAPSSCKVVSGVISGGGYCLVFAPQDVDLGK